MATINYPQDPISDFIPIYGSYYDVLTQSIAANTPTPVKIRNKSLENLVYVSNESRMNVVADGVYNIQFSLQLYRTSGGTAQQFYLWLRKDGVDVVSSATQLTFRSNGDYVVAAWNFVEPINAGSYVELVWMVTENTIQIAHIPNTPPVPDVPSAIVTIVRV